MKIKITEGQLKELYKSTYNSAAAKSVEQGNDELALDLLHHSNEMGIGDYDFYGVGTSDIDADGIPDDEDDELSVDRFDIRQRIQSELNTMLNEVGGYDDPEIMASHGGSVHGQLSRVIGDTVNIISIFVEHLKSGELSKKDLMVGTFNLSNKFNDDLKIIKELSKEIYLDDDFKELVLNYMKATKKVLNYFRLLSGHSQAMMSGKPTHFTYGLGMDMTNTELTLKISEKLASLGQYIEHLGEMFNTILRRYKGRLDTDD